MNVYIGRKRQRGHGIGDMMASAFKSLLPGLGRALVPNLFSAGSKLAQAGISKGTAFLGQKLGLTPAAPQPHYHQPAQKQPPKKRQKVVASKVAKRKKGGGRSTNSSKKQRRTPDIFDS